MERSKSFIEEINHYKDIYNDESFNSFLDDSYLYHFLNGDYEVEYLDIYFKNVFDILDIEIIKEDSFNEKIIKSVLDSLNDSSLDNDFKKKVSLKESVNLVLSFIHSLLPKYEEQFRYYCENKLYKGGESSYSRKLDIITIRDSKNISTAFELLHEFIHSQSGNKDSGSISFWEIPSYTSSIIFNDYLSSYYPKYKEDSARYISLINDNNIKDITRFLFIRKVHEYKKNGIIINRDSINEIINYIKDEYNINSLYILESLEKIFAYASNYSLELEKTSDDASMSAFYSISFKDSRDLDNDEKSISRIFSLLYESEDYFSDSISHAYGAIFSPSLYKITFDNDYNFKDFNSLNKIICGIRYSTLLNRLGFINSDKSLNEDIIEEISKEYKKMIGRSKNE